MHDYILFLKIINHNLSQKPFLVEGVAGEPLMPVIGTVNTVVRDEVVG